MNQKSVHEDGVSFEIFIEPVAKGRARIGRYGNVYTPQKTREFETMFGLQARASFKKGPLNGPVVLDVVFKLPKAKSNKDRHHTKKPDIDNLVKSVKDALNGIAWKDDSQVVTLNAHKRYVFGNSKPSIYVYVGRASG